MALPWRLTRRREAAVTAARRAVGTPFRPQGRVVGLGLDCVGLALIAAAAARVRLPEPPCYGLAGDHRELLPAALAAAGCRPVRSPRPGDLLVMAPARGQRHLAVVSDRGVIHAHAGLGRVVEGPVDSEWAVVGAWRLPGLR